MRTALILRTAGRIPVALAHHSLQAGGLWVVINQHLKPRKGLGGTHRLREGVQKEGTAISSGPVETESARNATGGGWGGG